MQFRSADLPSVSDVPREWQRADGWSFRGQLLWASETGGVIVVDGRQVPFRYEHLSPSDADYARNWPGPVIEQSGVTNRDAHLPPPETESDGDDAFGGPRASSTAARSSTRTGLFAGKASARFIRTMIVAGLGCVGILIRFLLGRGRRRATA